MKTIDCTFEELFEKLDSLKNEKNVYVCYYDVLPEEVTNHKKWFKNLEGVDSFFKLEDLNLIFFIRTASVKDYKNFMKGLYKYDNFISLLNRIIPISLRDCNNNTEYFVKEELINEDLFELNEYFSK